MQAPGQVQRGSGEGSEGSREGLGFGAETGQVQQGSRNRVQSQVRFNWFNKVPEKVPEKVWEAPGQVQQGSGEGSGEGSGRLWCRARSGSTGFWRRFRRSSWEALVQSQVRFNGSRRRLQRRSRRRFWGNLWCRARSGSNRFKGFQRLVSQHVSERGFGTNSLKKERVR